MTRPEIAEVHQKELILMKWNMKAKEYANIIDNGIKKKNKQNFQGEITSGFIMKLIKITQENRLISAI